MHLSRALISGRGPGVTLTSGRTLPSSTDPNLLRVRVHRRQGWERRKQICITGRESEQHPSCVTVPHCSLGCPLPLPTCLQLKEGGRDVGTCGHIQGLAPGQRWLSFPFPRWLSLGPPVPPFQNPPEQLQNFSGCFSCHDGEGFPNLC